MTEVIAAAGAGRMGRGLTIVFAYAGHPVRLIDLKTRDDAGAYLQGASAEITATLETLVACGMMTAGDVGPVAARIDYVPAGGAEAALAGSDVIFEGVPETLDAKRAALDQISRAAPEAIIASTTSTQSSRFGCTLVPPGKWAVRTSFNLVAPVSRKSSASLILPCAKAVAADRTQTSACS